VTSSLQIVGSRSNGGAEGFFCRLTNALAAHDKTTWAMLPPDSVLNEQLTGDVKRVSQKMRGVWDVWARMAISSWIRRHAPPVAQTWMGRATRLTHVPRGAPTVHIARLGGYYDVRGYAHASAWVGNTRGICDYLIKNGLPAERVFHIGNFVEPVPPPSAQAKFAARQSLSIHPDALVSLTTGRLHPNKGFADLLHAISELPAEIDDRKLLFLLVGDGPLRESLHTLSESLGIDDRVRWTGWQTNTAPYYQASDLFVCPSRHEPLGNVVLEAWSHELPLLATRAEGPSELMTDDKDGRLVALEDPMALARSIKSLLQLSSTDRGELITNGLAKVQRLYSPEIIRSRYLELYKDLSSHR